MMLVAPFKYSYYILVYTNIVFITLMATVISGEFSVSPPVTSGSGLLGISGEKEFSEAHMGE